MMFFGIQGQVTPKTIVLTGHHSKLSEIFMAVMATCKFEDDLIRSEGAALQKTFSPL